MSDKNFMSNNDAVDVLTDYAGAINKRLCQCSTMPTASQLNLNLIVQYVGTTTSNYTNGYFYKCVEGTTSGTYVWQHINTQDIGGFELVISGTLLANGWNSTTKRQTLTFTGYSTDANGVIGVPTNATQTQLEAYSEAHVRVYSTANESITFECENIPEIDLPVTLYIFSSGSIERDDYAKKSIIAAVEATNTATSAHNKDTYFINASNQLVKATSNIAVGDTISASNTTVTTVIDIINALNTEISEKSDEGTVPVNPSSTTGMNIWIETE